MKKTYLIFGSVIIVLLFGFIDIIIGQSKFAIIGDFGDDDAEELAVSVLVKSWNPDFIITAGDNSYDSTPIDDNIGKYYHDYIYPYVGSWGAGSPNNTNRFWVSLGNHDYSDGGGITAHYNYFDLPNNERYYDQVIGNVHLFMVNSNTQESDGTSSTSTQANWISTKIIDCKTNHLHWRVVAFHHPPYSSGEHQSSTYMRWPFETWGTHFVVSGHDHNYERLEIGGIPYFVNGSGGRNLRAFGTILPQSAARDAAHFGAQLVTISNDSCYLDFYGIDGVRYDRRIITESALPVELASFSGSVNGSSIKLNWSTAAEVDNFGFEIERTLSARTKWQKIGFVHGSGNSNSTKEYSFIDKDLIGGTEFSYRLKQLDSDGKFKYSDIVYVKMVPAAFKLSQNFPNPFNPSTKISWQSPISSRQSLKVFDVLGNEVATLVDEFKSAGAHEVDFDTAQLSSGIYYYKLQAGYFIETKKMVFIK